jgi:hypothetical protein
MRASGPHCVRNRYYDPATGRFTQPDPIGLAGGMNLYGYANGDPVNFADPFGLYADRQDERGSIHERLADNVRMDAAVAALKNGVTAAEDSSAHKEAAEHNGESGPALEVTMHRSPAWRGCTQQQIMFRQLDSRGNLGEWILTRAAVVKNPKIRGVRVPITVGFYGGTFSSSSYMTPLLAAGQVFCNAGVGTFEAVGRTP